MIIELQDRERAYLIQAAQDGLLDTWDIQRIADEIRVSDTEFERWAEVGAEREREEQAIIEEWIEIEDEIQAEKKRCKQLIFKFD